MNVVDNITAPSMFTNKAHCPGNGVSAAPHIAVADVYTAKDLRMPDFDGKYYAENGFTVIERNVHKAPAAKAGLPVLSEKAHTDLADKGEAVVQMLVGPGTRKERIVTLTVQSAKKVQPADPSELVKEPFVKLRVLYD